MAASQASQMVACSRPSQPHACDLALRRLPLQRGCAAAAAPARGASARLRARPPSSHTSCSRPAFAASAASGSGEASAGPSASVSDGGGGGSSSSERKATSSPDHVARALSCAAEAAARAASAVEGVDSLPGASWASWAALERRKIAGEPLEWRTSPSGWPRLYSLSEDQCRERNAAFEMKPSVSA